MSERLARLAVLVLVLRNSSIVAQLNVYPGLKGLKELLGDVPSWVSYEEKERVEVRALSPFFLPNPNSNPDPTTNPNPNP